MLRFGLFGIPITIEPWFWLTAALLGWGYLIAPNNPDAIALLAAWMFVVLVSVLWHEMGHAVVFRKFGYSPQIVLTAFGGYASANGHLPRSRDILVSLAGPAAGFLLAGLILLLLQTGVIPPLGELPAGGRAIVGNLLVVNIFWSILNLMPLHPLDGGRILFAALGPARRRTALIVSIACGAILAGLCLLGGLLLATILFGLLTYQNYQRLQASGGW